MQLVTKFTFSRDLRILIEDRRGVLLMREIEARINGAQNDAQEA